MPALKHQRPPGPPLADSARGRPVLLATLDVPFDLPYAPELAESLRKAAELASRLGVDVIRLRVKSFHPVQAMLEVVAEQRAGIFVFGPDRSRIRRMRYRRAARAIRSGVTVLVWLAE